MATEWRPAAARATRKELARKNRAPRAVCMLDMRFDARSVYRADLFAGRSVLVTGGGTGIGRLIADAFAELGASVALMARDAARLERAAEEIRRDWSVPVFTHACDIANPASVKSAVAALFAWKPIDILINNAGANSLRPTEALTPVRWKAIVDVVLNGAFYMTREHAKRWIKTKVPGRVINIASTTGWTGSPYMAPSGAAKAGLVNLGRTLGSEWGRYGIRINDVSPGPVFTKGSFERLWLNEDVVATVRDRVPLGRFPEPRDIVGSVLFLASPAAEFITGSSLAVDGGESLKPSFGDLVDKFRPRRGDAASAEPDL